MKKTIIVLALAILMVGSAFADATSTTKNATAVVADESTKKINQTTGNTEATDIKLNLDLSPKYVFGITDKNTTFGDKQKLSGLKTVPDGSIAYTAAQVLKEIVMTADLDDLILKSTTAGDYFVSYWFYECKEDLALYAKIDSPLTYQGSGTTTDKETLIDYKATITTDGTVSDAKVELESDKENKAGSAEKKIAVASVTDVLGHVQQANMQIVLGPKDSTTGVLAKNITGDYLSTITLTLKSNS